MAKSHAEKFQELKNAQISKKRAEKPVKLRQPKTAAKSLQITEEVFNKILERIVEGEALEAICKEEGQPSISRFMRDMTGDLLPNMRKRYDEARLHRAMLDGEKVRAIGDKCLNDPNNISAPHARVALDAYKWHAERVAAAIYGPKQQTDIISSDSSLQFSIVFA